MILSFLLAFSSLPVWASSLPSKAQQDIQTLLEQNQNQYGIVGQAVAVLINGNPVFTAAAGFADNASGVEATDTTVFQIFSVSKLFALQRLGELVDAGKLEWDAPVSRYLKDLPTSWQQVTVRQCMNHVSGLPEYYRDFDKPMPKTAALALDRVREEPFEFETGTQVKYNQTNYLLLKMIVEKLSGDSYAEGFAAFTKKAGLKHTRHGDINANIPGRATTYEAVPGGLEPLTKLDQPHYMITATGLNSNARDLADWFSRLLAGEFVSKKTLTNMWQPVQLKDGSVARFAGGFERFENDAVIAVGHGGGGRNDVRHFMPKNGGDTISVVFLSNGGSTFRNPRDSSQRIANIVTGGNLFPLTALSDTMAAAIADDDWPAARAAYDTFKKADRGKQATEDMLNSLGYAVWGKHGAEKALPVFQLNIAEHPKSANPYDSLGEAQLHLGDKTNARKNYQKAQDIAPNSRVAEILKKLETP
nr:serine hydrolase domain-containing protein [Acanthopleuribacter pedis]